MKLSSLFNFTLALIAVALVVTLGSADALAQYGGPGVTTDPNSFLGKGQTKVEEVYTAVRDVIWYVGGFGLIVLGIMAFFGRFKWQHFFALAGGLFLIGVTDQLIQYMGV